MKFYKGQPIGRTLALSRGEEQDKKTCGQRSWRLALIFRPLIQAAFASLFLLVGPSTSFGLSPSHAVIESGEIEGDAADGLRIFLGIPYAAPPVNDLRWRAPRTPVSWTGVRQAKEFGRACPQAASKNIAAGDMSEDCLTLNIWSPVRRPESRLPVMVWLHGGGFNTGSARLPVYDGANLAKKG